MVALFDKLKPAPYLPTIADQEEVQKLYPYWRLRIFYSMYIGYMLYYFTRRCLTFVTPCLLNSGFDKGDVGLLASIMAVTYGISKLVNGLISDQSNTQYFMAIGLFFSGLACVVFGNLSTMWGFALVWGLNGWFQGCGWPACSRLLTHWYSRSERGRWWSLCSTSQHVAGALAPLLTAAVMYFYGWKMAMVVPGMLAVLGSLFLINRLRDSPQSLGLPEIEGYRKEPVQSGSPKQDATPLSMKEVLFGCVLNNPAIWLLGVSYFFLHVSRFVFADWGYVYLIEAKKYTPVDAAAIIFWFDIGGTIGTIAAGWLSDTLFSSNRGPVNVAFCLLTTLAIYAFWSHSSMGLAWDSVLYCSLGGLIFGPQMLIGVAAAESVTKKAASSAVGFIGWLAYLGTAVGGYPLGKISQIYGWDAVFSVILACSIVATLALLPLLKMSSKPVVKMEKA